MEIINYWLLQLSRRKALLAAILALLAAGFIFLPTSFDCACALLASYVITGCITVRRHSREWQHPWRLSRTLGTLPHLTMEGDLLVVPPCMTEAHLPFEATQQPKLRSGALLWASAATVTHTLARELDRQAILAAVKPLGFTPEKFLARCPILEEISFGGQRGLVVRDGLGRRAYFIGAPADLLPLCQSVWDQQERPVQEDDFSRLPTPCESLYGFAMATVDENGLGALTYLGSLLVEASLHEKNCSAARILGSVMAVYITPPAAAPELAERICRLSTAQPQEDTLHIAPSMQGDNCLAVSPEDDLLGLYLAGRKMAQVQYARLFHLLLLHLAFMLMLACWPYPAWMGLLPAVVLLPYCFASSRDYHTEEEHPHRLRQLCCHMLIAVWILLWPLLIHLFLRENAIPHMEGIGVVAALCAMFLYALVPPIALRGVPAPGWKLLCPLMLLALSGACVMLQLPLLPALFGLTAGALYPMGMWLLNVYSSCSPFSCNCS